MRIVGALHVYLCLLMMMMMMMMIMIMITIVLHELGLNRPFWPGRMFSSNVFP